MAYKKCQKCGQEKSVSHYIATNSQFHQGALPICRECIGELIAAAPQDGTWNIVDKLCQWADIPFVPEEWEKVYNGHGKSAFGVYASIFRSAPYDTLDWGMYNEAYRVLNEENRVEDALPAYREKQKKQLLAKWGQQYDDSELEYLENLHQGLLNSQNIAGALMEDQALKLCKLSLIIEIKMREGADFSRDLKAYDDLLKSSNLSPKVIKDANEFSSVGEVFAYLEKKGWVNPYYDEVNRDEVDFSIKDIKYWLQYLYVNETGVAEEIEHRIENLKAAAALSGQKFDKQEFLKYMQDQGSAPIDMEEEFEVDI